jgi:hypothetical protein
MVCATSSIEVRLPNSSISLSFATFINPSYDAISRFIPTTAVISFSVRRGICNIRWSRSSSRLANLACLIKMKLAIRIASKDKQVPKEKRKRIKV